jgi:hypothetical protein
MLLVKRDISLFSVFLLVAFFWQASSSYCTTAEDGWSGEDPLYFLVAFPVWNRNNGSRDN